MKQPWNQVIARDPQGKQGGIYSVCSAHPVVIEAALRQAQDDQSHLLIEATCNQVNQFGGYTGMQPEDFVHFVRGIAHQVGFDEDKMIFGGDHLGPNPWRHLSADEAMAHGQSLLKAYALAGFTKLHLDASMRCADDPSVLSDDVVAQRAAVLCQAAEDAAPGQAVYVIGTEVPVPGGATEALEGLQVTSPQAAQHTLSVHQSAFAALGLGNVWARVIGMVVQPGVEFDHTHVIDYQPEEAVDLSAFQKRQHQWVFEAHSTDYQRPEALAQLVQDGFAILKVGPGLTFALREALYALELIERELVHSTPLSALRATVEAEMLAHPKDWQSYYSGDEGHLAQMRVFSYSDRVRYYWGRPAIVAAVGRLMDNLNCVDIPENLVSLYLPLQYLAYREGRVILKAHSLLLDRVRDALRPYAHACNVA